MMMMMVNETINATGRSKGIPRRLGHRRVMLNPFWDALCDRILQLPTEETFRSATTCVYNHCYRPSLRALGLPIKLPAVPVVPVLPYSSHCSCADCCSWLARLLWARHPRSPTSVSKQYSTTLQSCNWRVVQFRQFRLRAVEHNVTLVLTFPSGHSTISPQL